jgi:lipid-A-disaccharide synthase
MAIVYKTSALNYSLLRPLISVEHFGLVNLIAGERVAREMIQHEFTAEALADELLRLLKPDVNAQVREKLAITTDKLGHGGASKRAAEAILSLVDR